MTVASKMPDKGALSLNEFLAWSSLGRTKALEEIATGRLPAVKVGRRLLIPVAAAQSWLSAQPRAVLAPLPASAAPDRTGLRH